MVSGAPADVWTQISPDMLSVACAHVKVTLSEPAAWPIRGAERTTVAVIQASNVSTTLKAMMDRLRLRISPPNVKWWTPCVNLTDTGRNYNQQNAYDRWTNA